MGADPEYGRGIRTTMLDFRLSLAMCLGLPSDLDSLLPQSPTCYDEGHVLHLQPRLLIFEDKKENL